MSDFSKQINEFQRDGTYEYKFDEGGNLNFSEPTNIFEEKYVSIPLINYRYNNIKILSLYDLKFREFVPTTIDISVISNTTTDRVNDLVTENEKLKEKLNVLTIISDANMTDAERVAIKQIIIELRVQLKQGIAERDFSTTFPYLPLTKK